MKRIVLLAAAFLMVFSSYANDPIKELMSKYKGEKGITTINISNGLLFLLSCVDNDDELDKMSKNLDGIRIIVDESRGEKVRFTDELKEYIAKGGYEEMITVNEEDEKVRILIKHNKEKIQEMLILVDSDDENVLVQMTGDFKLSDLGDISGDIHIHGMEHVKDIDLK